MYRILSTIKSALICKKKEILFFPYSFCKTFSILKLLYFEGYIKSYFLLENKIQIVFNYLNESSLMSILKIFSKKKFIIYLSYKDLCLFNELNCILFISTIKGIITHYKALKLKIGGKMIFFIR